MALWYFLRNAAGLLISTLGAFADFIWQTLGSHGRLSLDQRARWLHRWCAFVLPKVGVDVIVEGQLPPPCTMIVSNHLSYLDILVYSAAVPTLFVAKKEVRSWLVFGLLAHLAGTRFLDRSRAVDAHRVQNELQTALEEGCRVVVFPEGSSTDGSLVLPFKPALFEAAVGKYAVVPAYLAYLVEGGSAAQDACYWGDMTFFPHLLRLLSKRATHARVSFAEPVQFADRKQAALESFQRVSALGQKL